jgi:hypothetical protein
MAIDAFRKCIEKAQYFVFTLGLTESWFNSAKGYEYPMCPGTTAGEFDASAHKFVNQDYNQIRTSLAEAMQMMQMMNSRLRFILTVSPVPLTATRSGQHVVVATMYSKSVLRAVAGALAMNMPNVDYFPSYEIINAPVFRGAFFEPNQRSVNPFGVKFVMDSFFRAVGEPAPVRAPAAATPQSPFAGLNPFAGLPGASKQDEFCDEALLAAFGPQK